MSCPICGDDVKLDFHHWDYDEDIGIEICRDCHNEIHDGLHQSHQENKARAHGYDGWLHRAVDNLVELDIAYTRPVEYDVGVRSWDDYRKRLMMRYNVPDSAIPSSAVGIFPYVKQDPSLFQAQSPAKFGFSGRCRTPTLDEKLNDGFRRPNSGPLSARSRENVRERIKRADSSVDVEEVQRMCPFLEESEAVNDWIAAAINSIHGSETEEPA